MKSCILVILLLVVSGCSHLPRSKIAFRPEAAKLESDEAIEQVSLYILNAQFVKAKRLPTDWTADFKNKPDGLEVILNCEHIYFSISDLKELSGLLYIESRSVPRLSESKIYTTKGPTGPGRIITLSSDDVIFKK